MNLGGGNKKDRPLRTSWNGQELTSGAGKNWSEMDLKEIDPDVFVIWAERERAWRSCKKEGDGERVREKTGDDHAYDVTMVKGNSNIFQIILEGFILIGKAFLENKRIQLKHVCRRGTILKIATA